jgi:flagellar biosynthesis/type III secretory pathway M-ring protein FliF/YscJ
MQILIVILAFALLAVVLFVVSAPLRAGATQDEPEPVVSHERAELEAAREAKYREIRDAELDLRTGKLSREDYDATDGALRSEALEILDRLQALDEPAGATADREPTAGEGSETTGRQGRAGDSGR